MSTTRLVIVKLQVASLQCPRELQKVSVFMQDRTHMERTVLSLSKATPRPHGQQGCVTLCVNRVLANKYFCRHIYQTQSLNTSHMKAR